MSNEKEYNGWTNYETWLVDLWLSNDQETDEMMNDMAIHSKDVYSLMESIRDFVEELNPLKDNANLFSDLLNAGISECNFYEIAEHYFEDNKENQNDQEDESED